MGTYRVFFWSRPAHHRWRACSDVVVADSAEAAIEQAQRTDYGMRCEGPYHAQETTDPPGTCWRPRP